MNKENTITYYKHVDNGGINLDFCILENGANHVEVSTQYHGLPTLYSILFEGISLTPGDYLDIGLKFIEFSSIISGESLDAEEVIICGCKFKKHLEHRVELGYRDTNWSDSLISIQFLEDSCGYVTIEFCSMFDERVIMRSCLFCGHIMNASDYKDIGVKFIEFYNLIGKHEVN